MADSEDVIFLLGKPEQLPPEYEDALRDTADADKIRQIFNQYPLSDGSHDQRIRHDSVSIDDIDIPIDAHPVDVLEPLPEPAWKHNWVIGAIANGDNAEILVAAYWLRGLSLRKTAEKMGDISYETVRKILADLKERYG